MSGRPDRIDRRPGFHRTGDRPGVWVDQLGQPVPDDESLARLRRLAIPPAWIHVWASPDPLDRVQATGVDARGRTQYRYSTAATAFASDAKFEHMIAFAEALPPLRARVAADLRGRIDPSNAVSSNQVIAGIVRLLDRGLFRVGNERYAHDNHTYGLTTIQRGHLTVSDSAVIFDFIGKEHLHHHITVHDHGAARIVRALLDRPGHADAELFVAEDADARHVVHSTEVNAYLHTHTSAPATAKVFRTWGATCAAAAVAGGAETPLGEGRPIQTRAILAAAALLGDTPAVTRTSYVHPAAIEAGRSAAVTTAVAEAASRLGTRTVQALFSEPTIQSAILTELLGRPTKE